MEKYTGFSGAASLAAVGLWMKEQRIWEAVEARVKIRQKVLEHTPTDKLKDGNSAKLTLAPPSRARLSSGG